MLLLNTYHLATFLIKVNSFLLSHFRFITLYCKLFCLLKMSHPQLSWSFTSCFCLRRGNSGSRNWPNWNCWESRIKGIPGANIKRENNHEKWVLRQRRTSLANVETSCNWGSDELTAIKGWYSWWTEITHAMR